VGLLPLAMTKMFLAGKILIAAARVGPMMLADLYCVRKAVSKWSYALGVLDRESCASSALTHGISNAVLLVYEFCVD
jgi:hypothetical protein